MKRIAFVSTLLIYSYAFAIGPQMSLVNQESQLLTLKLNTCAIEVKTLFVQIRSKSPTNDIDVKRCVEDGKTAVKSSYNNVKNSFRKNKIPAEFNDWRLEWMSAFDGALPADNDIERVYLQRQSDSKEKINRATNKLEIALE